MSYVLAIQPRQGQAEALRHAVESNSRASLTVVDSVTHALAAIDEEIPTLVLASALMSRLDEATLIARLRYLPAHEAPQILIMPALAPLPMQPRRRTLLDRWRNRTVVATDSDLSAFAGQLATYLDQADRRPAPALWENVCSAQPSVSSGADRRAAVRLERLVWATARVDGAVVDLIDLSVTGAQIVAPIVLQPGGSAQVLLTRGSLAIGCEAAIVWGGFEIAGPTNDSCYRAGIHFKEADHQTVERFYYGRT